MTGSNVRVSLLTLGSLCAAFAVIYAFTPGGFSWGLAVIGSLMALPWFGHEALEHRRARRSPEVPRWHPEYEPR